MKKISKTRAFIEIAETINSGDGVKANAMMNIVGKAIAADNRKKTFNSEIELSREDKVYFSKK